MSGRTLVFVNTREEAPAAEPTTDVVVLDTAWTPEFGERPDLIPVRPSVERGPRPRQPVRRDARAARRLGRGGGHGRSADGRRRVVVVPCPQLHPARSPRDAPVVPRPGRPGAARPLRPARAAGRPRLPRRGGARISLAGGAQRRDLRTGRAQPLGRRTGAPRSRSNGSAGKAARARRPGPADGRRAARPEAADALPRGPAGDARRRTAGRPRGRPLGLVPRDRGRRRTSAAPTRTSRRSSTRSPRTGSPWSASAWRSICGSTPIGRSSSPIRDCCRCRSSAGGRSCPPTMRPSGPRHGPGSRARPSWRSTSKGSTSDRRSGRSWPTCGAGSSASVTACSGRSGS